MKALAALPLLLLAACATRRAPEGVPVRVTFYDDAPRLETWDAFVVEGAHVHASVPGPCLMEQMDRLRGELFRERGLEVPELGAGFCGSLLGPAHGGPQRLVLLLLPAGRDPAEALAVDLPRLAAGESEKTFTPPLLRVEHERPSGKRGASIARGRATLRRLGPGRWDLELFAVLSNGAQVLARVAPPVD